jgi:hypothetical protein
MRNPSDPTLFRRKAAALGQSIAHIKITFLDLTSN